MPKRIVGLFASALLMSLAILVAASAMLDADDKKPNSDPKWKVTRPDPSKETEPADNSYCLVCHVNLEEEELVSYHRPKGVGCETCHGFSDDHSSDEDNLTAPEIMWAKARINPRCMTCHPKHELLASEDGGDSHEEVLARWSKPPKEEDEGERYCIDCHGDHHIPNRTREWDKETGKLLKGPGGPIMDQK